jgi:pimeloyl-ACP methyl ester carboxylesterase
MSARLQVSTGARRTAAVLLFPALLAGLILGSKPSPAAQPSAEPLGIALEGYAYPFPVQFLPLSVAGHAVRLAYMDVRPSGPVNGRTVLLMHGRNFPASYWESTIRVLVNAGYRVIAPDQINFGKSSKLDDVPVSFDAMAAHTAALLDYLIVERVDVVAHSMGNMAAVRFARTYPDRVGKLVMYGPVGLEDYRFYVPPVPEERLVEQEDKLTAEAYLNQLVTTYGLTLPKHEVQPFVDIRERMKGSAEWPRWVRSFVSSYYAMWGQPVVHELPLVDKPVLFLVGTRDRTAPGRPFAKPEDRDRMGRIAERAQELAPRMRDARVEVFEGVGHLIHLEAAERFNAVLTQFLDQ